MHLHGLTAKQYYTKNNQSIQLQPKDKHNHEKTLQVLDDFFSSI